METLKKIDIFFEAIGQLFGFLTENVFPVIILLWISYLILRSLFNYISEWGWIGVLLCLLHWAAGPILLYFGAVYDLPILFGCGGLAFLSALATGSED